MSVATDSTNDMACLNLDTPCDLQPAPSHPCVIFALAVVPDGDLLYGQSTCQVRMLEASLPPFVLGWRRFLYAAISLPMGFTSTRVRELECRLRLTPSVGLPIRGFFGPGQAHTPYLWAKCSSAPSSSRCRDDIVNNGSAFRMKSTPCIPGNGCHGAVVDGHKRLASADAVSLHENT